MIATFLRFQKPCLGQAFYIKERCSLSNGSSGPVSSSEHKLAHTF